MMIREGLSFNFYIRRFHEELLPGLLRSLEEYRRVVGPEGLGTYWDREGDPQDLDAAGWALTMRDLTEGRRFIFHLGDGSGSEGRYDFKYHAKKPSLPSLEGSPNWVSVVSFWLPTEYLEEHGPAQVRALALALAEPLPFCSGHAGLAFNALIDFVGVLREVRERCFRYPGLDIPEVGHLSWNLGSRVRGAAWLTFIGQPVLGELGGAARLRARLHTPGTTVEEMDGERAVVTLGEWPEAGDTEQGRDLPAYRELARVLEPWLYHQSTMLNYFTREDLRRWERRFLD